MTKRSRPIEYLSETPTFRDESGITLLELMMAVTIMGLVIVGVLAFARLGVVAKSTVDKGVRYSQQLALMSEQVVEGAGDKYRGLREATNVRSEPKPGHTCYVFDYSDSEKSRQEQYWISDATLYRSTGDGLPERMGDATALEVSGPSLQGICTLKLGFTNGDGHDIEHVMSVRLRNHSRKPEWHFW